MAPPVVHETLRSSGQPLDAAARAFMEPRFGRDFASVRVHADRRAAESARAVDAHAYTVGQRIVFGEGQYNPATPRGRTLLAHELAHVVQQGASPVPAELKVGQPGDATEREADAVARTVVSGSEARGSLGRSTGVGGPRVQRDPQEDAGANPPSNAQAPTAVPQASNGAGQAGAAIEQTANQIRSDSDHALGVRIPLEEDLVALAANPGSTAESGVPLPGAGGPTPAPKGGTPPQKAQTGTATGRDSDEGLNPNRVKQGNLGDCYLMAAMAAVARVNPDAIRRLIKPHPPGKYDVTLYEHRWLISDAKHVETVDTTVPTDASGKPLYGGNVAFKDDVEADRPLWPLLIEKAYAQWKGGYKAIGKGGDPAGALENLTGHSASAYKVADYSADDIGKRIDAARTKGKAITAWTATMPSDLTVVARGKSAGEGIAKVGNNRVAFSHAYAVSNVELAVMTINLQNPWGTDNIEDMSLAEFRHVFYAWDEGSTS